MITSNRPGYDEAMEKGRRQYLDVLEALSMAGWPGEFTQTGGMCAAIEVALEDGLLVVITDAQGPLAWERASHRGWGVGVYDGDNLDEWIALEDDESSEVETLLRLIPLALRHATGVRETTRAAKGSDG